MVMAHTGSPPDVPAQQRMTATRQLGDGEIDYVRGLNRLLIRAVRALGDAGEADLACRIAAKAWAALRKEWPDEAERLNGALHYLTRPNSRQRKETQ
jgi:hypothetical protein